MFNRIINRSLPLYLLFILVLVQKSFSQPDTLWTKTFGGSGSDQGSSVQLTTDGGYIIIGLTYSYAVGYDDIWLIKTDSFGIIQWDTTFGGSNEDAAFSVQQTLDGGYIVAGLTKSYGAGNRDAWLIKTDEIGNEEWNRVYGGSEEDWGYCIQQTADSGYIMVGGTRSYGAGQEDIWLIKTDSLGIIQWDTIFGGSLSEEGNSVQQTTDGGYILVGYTGSYGAGSWDVWLIKIDSKGNEEWSRTLGGSNEDEGFSVQQTADGGYIILGETYSYGAGGKDFWLIKTDSLGILQWDTTFGGSYEDQGSSIQQTTDLGYILTGATYSYGEGLSDLWLIKTDENGNEEWSKTLGGSDLDGGSSMQQTTDGGYIIAGLTKSFGAGDYDVWLIRVAAEIGLYSGLVALYPFNGNANDESGNGHDGTVNGATLTEDRFGNSNSAYSFNNDNINIGQGWDTESGTISMWIYQDNIGGVQRFLSDRSGSTNYLSLFVNTANQLGATMSGDSWIDVGQIDTLSTDRWYHIVFTWGLDGMRLYIDATLNDSEVSTQSWSENSNMLIGNSEAYSSQGWIGIIDDVRIYNRALTEEEIDSLYQENGWPNLSVDEYTAIPTQFNFHQNYPNPFNPTTNLRFDLPEKGHAWIIVYDIMGWEVVELMRGEFEAGYHSIVWNGKNSAGKDVPTGIYFARLVTLSFSDTIKMVLMK